MTESLWGEIPTAALVSTPNAILNIQGDILKKATKDALRCFVSKEPVRGKFHIDFFLVAPKLNNYRYHLLQLVHDVKLYPVEIYLEGAYVKEAMDEESFKDELAQILSSENTKNIIKALLAQIRDEDADIPF